MAFIYVITNDINNKQYVGKTNGSIQKRFHEHVLDSRKRRCEKRPLYNAMRKYGVEHFHIEILEECSAEEAANKEIYWIDQLQTYGNSGYNATKGGDSKKYYDYDKIAHKYLELQNQKETAKFFNCDVGVVQTACKEYGIQTLSSQQISIQDRSKKIAMIDSKSEQIIRVFTSINEAARYLVDIKIAKTKNPDGVHIHLSRAARNYGKIAYGFKWKMV